MQCRRHSSKVGAKAISANRPLSSLAAQLMQTSRSFNNLFSRGRFSKGSTDMVQLYPLNDFPNKVENHSKFRDSALGNCTNIGIAISVVF